MKRDPVVDKRVEALLERLTNVAAVPGCEDEMRVLMRKEAKGIGSVETDNLGSLIVEKKGAASSPRIMLAAHMDEIGFMVRGLTDGGYIRFSPLGGWWAHVMLAQRVRIRTRKGYVPGLIGAKPVHQVPKDQRDRLMKIEDMFIDVGATSRKDAEVRLGIRIGDPVVPEAPWMPLAGRRVAAKALDNRVGCAVMLEVLRRLKGKKHPNHVYGVGTVQEEVGARGARTAVQMVNPDLSLIVDVGLAGDTPDASRDVGVEGRLGGGPQICVLDAGMIGNTKLRDLVVKVAERKKIAYQLFAISSGATDGSHIHLHGIGVPSLYLGVPTRYIHSHQGVLDLDDVEQLIRLVVSVLEVLDDAALRQCR